jgi:hypothetical protein
MGARLHVLSGRGHVQVGTVGREHGVREAPALAVRHQVAGTVLGPDTGHVAAGQRGRSVLPDVIADRTGGAVQRAEQEVPRPPKAQEGDYRPRHGGDRPPDQGSRGHPGRQREQHVGHRDDPVQVEQSRAEQVQAPVGGRHQRGDPPGQQPHQRGDAAQHGNANQPELRGQPPPPADRLHPSHPLQAQLGVARDQGSAQEHARQHRQQGGCPDRQHDVDQRELGQEAVLECPTGRAVPSQAAGQPRALQQRVHLHPGDQQVQAHQAEDRGPAGQLRSVLTPGEPGHSKPPAGLAASRGRGSAMESGLPR